MADLSALDALIAKLRRTKAFVIAAAPAAAEAMATALRATAAAGTTPDGAPWEPRKGGGRALANAASKINVRAVGTVLLARLDAPEALHDKGQARGHVQRQILPRTATAAVMSAVKESLVASWEASQ